ncbi:competence protein CoiA family protein [Cupriavidus sp. Agwp_2]|uniref:competence protein CoiA family protein n=1 Tax=Cupriavidus sp. Agwp_2 TaxID=2897324 RepID=UPI003460912D
MIKSAKLPYALDPSGKIVSVQDVPNGLACNCTCPGCGARLIAKQGSEQVWHFSHYRAENCQAGYESALHLAVKALLEADPQIALPTCFVVRHETEGSRTRGSKDSTWSGVFEYVTGESEQVWARDLASVHHRGIAELPGKMVRFDRVEVERAHGSIRPDLVGIVGERRINLEVAVTHFIDNEKLAKIRDLAVPTLEIVLPPSIDPDWEALRKILHSPDGKFWRFNPLAEQRAEADYQARQAARVERRQRDAERRRRDEERRQREAERMRAQQQEEMRARQQAAEVRKQKAVLREEALQEAIYGLLAEVVLRRERDSFYVRWNQSTVNLSSDPPTSSGTLGVWKIGQAFSGRQYKGGFWEFPPGESVFFQIVGAVKAEGALVERFSLPEGMDARASAQAIGFLLAPSHTGSNIGPHPARRSAVAPYCVIYRYGDQFATIALDNMSLTLRVVPPHPNDELQNRITEVFKRFRGQYNDRNRQLEFPPVEASFFAVASALRPATANHICRLFHPGNVKTGDVLRRLGFDVP